MPQKLGENNTISAPIYFRAGAEQHSTLSGGASFLRPTAEVAESLAAWKQRWMAAGSQASLSNVTFVSER